MKRLIFLCNVLLFSLGICAQPKAQSQDTYASIMDKINPDSLARLVNAKAGLDRQAMRNKLASGSDSVSSSDYMLSIERANERLNALRDSSKLGFEIGGFKKKIADINDDIDLIRQNVRGRTNVVNIKNLHLYQNFLTNIDKDMDQIQFRLNMLYNKIFKAKSGLKNLLGDSIFHELRNDKSISSVFEKKIVKFEIKWIKTDSTVRANLATLNDLKLKAADNSIATTDLLSMVQRKLDRAGMQLFGPEVAPIWAMQTNDTLLNRSAQQFKSAFSGEQKAVGYYVSQTSQQRSLIFIVAVILFWWLYSKRKLFKAKKESFAFLHLQYLSDHPILSILVVLLCMTPLFDAYAPTTYMSIEHFFLLTVISVIFYHKWERSLWHAWIVLAVLFVAVAVANTFIEPVLIQRIGILALHLGIVVFAIRFLRKFKEGGVYYKWIRTAIVVTILLGFLAIFCNAIGRFSLSGIFGIASIFAITQAIALMIFIETIFEIVLVQLQSSRLKKGIEKAFDTSLIITKIKMPLAIIVGYLWLIMLTSNLNIYHSLNDSLGDFLSNPRNVGSISFKLSSLILFFVIIWIAHILQRLISFLFGETGSEDDITSVTKGQHSRLLISRLLVLVGGYFLAIAASGLPLDKITIVLGALGVGIGMGLQNIVNNFVSGVILIFDGSLQIGDEIEVSGQAGKVKEIGLRASTVNTADGAEVIIPNGNILSQNIVNWTYSNDQRRVVIEFSLTGKELDTNTITEVINRNLQAIPNVIVQKKPIIIFTKVKQNTCWLTIRFWSSIAKIDQVKSEAILRLNAGFTSKGMTME